MARAMPRRRILLASPFLALMVAGSLTAAVPSLIGAPAPEFHVRALNGRDLRLSSLRQHGPVIVEFWATRCDSCAAALTELDGWRRRYGPKGLSVVAFSVDGTRNVSLVRPYVQRLHLRAPVAMDDGQRVQNLYLASRMPTSFLVDPKGNITAIREGYERSDTSFMARLESTLGAGSTATGGVR